MFFPYYIPCQYVVPNYQIHFNQTYPLTDQIKYKDQLQFQQNINKLEKITNIQDVILPGKNRFLDLQIEDLKQAGYENKKKVWTQEQDNHLKLLVKLHGTQWNQIQKLMPQRNAKMCYSRFKRIQSSQKKIWKKSQNQKLQQLVHLYKNDWKVIASNFKNRSEKQIKEHYENYLRPDLTHQEWTLGQDIKLINLLNEHGTQWKKIKEEMPHRGENLLKNRYFARLKKIMDKKLQAKRRQQQQRQHTINDSNQKKSMGLRRTLKSN